VASAQVARGAARPSNLVPIEVHADAPTRTIAGFTECAILLYAEHGITVRRVIADNALGYSSLQRTLLTAYGSGRIHTRPWLQTSGNAECFIRTLISTCISRLRNPWPQV